MLSVNDCLTKAVRLARSRLGGSYRTWQEKYGIPAEHTALNSLHFLLTEYQEPPPFEVVAPYKLTAPAQPVATRREYLAHPTLKKRLSVDLTFPAEVGPGESLPTVVISPGLGAHGNATRYLEKHLAAHGYLVVKPTHAGSDWMAVAFKTPLGAFTRTEFRRRIAEVDTTLDGLFSGAWGISADPERLCLLGHSFGALTNGMVAGLQAQDIQRNTSYTPRAFVALSPYGNSFPTQRLGIDPRSFRELTMPTLFVSGTKDDLFTLGKGSRSHLEPYLTCQAAVKSHLLIGGTRHGNFSEILGWVRRNTQIMVNTTVTAFLDAHLKDDEAGTTYMQNQLPLVAFEHGSWVL